MKRQQPTTSIAAYESMKGEPIETHHQKILEGLAQLKEANYEEIALHLQMNDRNRVSRRLKELEKLELIEKTGNERPTSSGRMAKAYRVKPKVVSMNQGELFN